MPFPVQKLPEPNPEPQSLHFNQHSPAGVDDVEKAASQDAGYDGSQPAQWRRSNHLVHEVLVSHVIGTENTIPAIPLQKVVLRVPNEGH